MQADIAETVEKTSHEKLWFAESRFGLEARPQRGSVVSWLQESPKAADSCWEIVSPEERRRHQAGTWLYSNVAADSG